MEIKRIEIEENFVKSEIEKIISESLKNIDLNETYKFILSVIDLTTLEGNDTNKKVKEICNRAKSFNHSQPDIPNVAAVCFYPNFAALAKSQLKNSDVKVACVAGAFPSGQSPLEVRIAEVKYAVENGADEIDMVISRGKFLEGDFDFVSEEISEIKKACGDKHLKVILETGELKTLSNVRYAADIAMEAGADFIKTSTGKIKPAATLEAFYVMLLAIKDFYKRTNKMIGIKPAGGISDAETALKYYGLLKGILGEKWEDKEFFRIGASSLVSR
jgi:deoxyribose-phosphate aldolase